MGDTKGGAFDISAEVAQAMLASSESRRAIERRRRPPLGERAGHHQAPRGMWIIDFGDMSIEEAALYEAPFEYVKKHVKPQREASARQRMPAVVAP